MDEPTAALPAEEVRHLHNVVRMLCERGVAIVYVSHFLDETLALSNTVTVLRNGYLVATRPATEWSVQSLVTAMLGHSLEANYPSLPEVASNAPLRLSVRQLADGDRLRDANLDVRNGEIVGLFGLVGSGRSELAHTLFGASPVLHGTIVLEGRSYQPRSPSQSFAGGIALLPESRKDQGLCLGHSKLDNGGLNSLDRHARAGFIDRRREASVIGRLLEGCAVDTSDLDFPVGALSGGNQQKVLLAKTLSTDPRVLILDEPTRGVDIGARRAIYDTIARLVEDGMSVILISSDIDEVQKMSHRLYVLRDGRTVAEFDSAQSAHGEILNAAFGVATSLASLESAGV